MNWIERVAKILKDKVVLDVGGQFPVKGHIDMGAYAQLSKANTFTAAQTFAGGISTISLPADVNLDTIKTSGWYWVPIDGGRFFLWVMVYNNIVEQIRFGFQSGNISTRRFDTVHWNDWTTMATQADITALNNKITALEAQFSGGGLNLLTVTSSLDGTAKVFDKWDIPLTTTLVNAGDRASSARDVVYNDGHGVALDDGGMYTLAYDYDFGDTTESYDYYLSQDSKGVGIGFGVGTGTAPASYTADSYAQRRSYQLYGGKAGHVAFKFQSNSGGGRYPYFAWRPWVLPVTYDATNHPLILSITNLALWEGPECVWQPNSRDAFIYLQKLQTQLQGGTN